MTSMYTSNEEIYLFDVTVDGTDDFPYDYRLEGNEKGLPAVGRNYGWN